MELLSGLTDDQTALIGCAIALATCGGLMSLSYYLGRGRERQQAVRETIRLHQPHDPARANVPAHRRRAA